MEGAVSFELRISQIVTLRKVRIQLRPRRVNSVPFYLLLDPISPLAFPFALSRLSVR